MARTDYNLRIRYFPSTSNYVLSTTGRTLYSQYKMEFDNVKPGREVAVMTGFRRPLYGRRHPPKDKSAARIIRMKHKEFQEVDKIRNPKNYFREMKKAQSEEPQQLPVVHRVKKGKKIEIDVEPIFQANPIQAYMRELEQDHKDRKARMVEDDLTLEKYIQKHRELVSADALDSQMVIDDIVHKSQRPVTTRTTKTTTKVSEPIEPFVVEDYGYTTKSSVDDVVHSKAADEGLDPTLKKKIKQSKDELADLEYDLTHRAPSFRGRGTSVKCDVTSGGSGSGRGSLRYSEWDDVDLYGLVDDLVAATGGDYEGDYAGWAVRNPDEDNYYEIGAAGSEVNLPWLILSRPSAAGSL